MLNLLLLLALSVASGHLLLPEIISPLQKETLGCAKEVVDKYDVLRSIFVFSYDGIMVDSLAQIASKSSVRVSNTDLDLSPMKIPKQSQFIMIVIDEISDLWHYFQSLHLSLGFNAVAKYFIIYTGDEHINDLFKVIMEFFALRSVVMDKYNNVYISEPFEKTCGRSKATLLSNCKLVKMREIDKVFRYRMGSWFGCRVKALALVMPPYVIDVNDEKSPGFEVEIFRMAAKKYNFTIEYVEHNFTQWGFKVDGNYTMLGQALYEKRGDVLFGMLNMNDTYLGDFSGCVPYLDGDYAFYVPAAQIISPWKKVVTVFTTGYWVAIIASFVTVNIIIYCMSKVKNEKIDKSNIYAVLFMQSIKLPKSQIIKNIFILWSLISFILKSSYESGLISLLTKPAFEPQIESIEDIIKSGLVIAGQSSMKELFSESRNIYNKKAYEKWIDCPLGIMCVNLTATKRSVASFSNTRNVRYYMKAFLDKYGIPKIYQLPVHTKTFMWMVMRKGFPLVHQMNYLILFLRQSGLLAKFSKDIYYRDQSVHFNINAKIQISLEHFFLPFAIYFLGLALATIAFIFEIVIARKQTIIYKN